MTYLSTCKLNPGIGALTAYLLKQTDYRRFVYEDHLHQLCDLTASICDNGSFAVSCQESIIIHPSMTPYLHAILLQSSQEELKHCEKIWAFLVILFSRLRQANESICYAISSVIVEKHTLLHRTFNLLKEVFVNGCAVIDQTSLPMAPLFELFIRREGLGSLEAALTEHYDKIPVLAAIVHRTTGRSIVESNDLLLPEVREVLLQYFNQAVHFPLLIPGIIRGLNFNRSGFAKTELIQRLSRDLSFSGIVFDKKSFKKEGQKSFWFVDLPEQPSVCHSEKVLEITSGPLRGQYPLPVRRKRGSLVIEALKKPRILIFCSHQGIQPCWNADELNGVLFQMIQTPPCSDQPKKPISCLTGDNQRVITDRLLSQIGGLDPAVIKVLDPEKRLIFKSIGGFSSRWIAQPNKTRKFESRACPMKMAMDLFEFIRSAPSPQLFALAMGNHILTIRPGWIPSKIAEIKDRTERVAKDCLNQEISPSELWEFLCAVNSERSKGWLKELEKASARCTYHNAIFVIRSTAPKQPNDIDRASDLLDEKLLSIDPTVQKVRRVVKHLALCPLSCIEKVVRGVRLELNHRPSDLYGWARAVCQVASNLGLPYNPTFQVAADIARALDLPEMIYLGDTNWGERIPIHRSLQYRLANGQWEIRDHFPTEGRRCVIPYIAVYP